MTEKVNAGQSINGLSSSVWNKMVDLSNSKKNINDINFEKNRGFILIKNTTDNLLPAFSVLQIDGTVTDQGSLPIDMKDVEIVFKGKIPEDDTIVNFCVTQEPLGQGEIGDAIVYGATKVHLTNDDEIDGDWNAALPRAGKTDAMKKSDGTGSQIVWVKDIEENGSRKAVVILNNISCPARPLPTQRYNVLKYYSMNRCFQDGLDHGGPGSDINGPEYNNPKVSTLNRGLMAGEWNWRIREKGAPPAIFAITNIASNNFLTIQNQRDIFADQQKYTPVQVVFGQTEYNSLTYYWDYDNPSTQHIEPIDEFREKNEDGFIEIDLYEKNASKTFKGVFESTPTAKEVDSMEWLFLHTKVFECQKGYVYIEISDLMITGDNTDNMLYVICWESSEGDQVSTLSQIDNDNDYFDNTETVDIRSQFYHIDNSNRVEQAIRIKDIIVPETKKIVLNTNKFVDVGEEKYISVLIGLSPEDIARDYMYWEFNSSGQIESFSQNALNSNDKVTMKLSNVSIKIKDFGEAVNAKPILAPCEGGVGIYENGYIYSLFQGFIGKSQPLARMKFSLSPDIVGNDGLNWDGLGSHTGYVDLTSGRNPFYSHPPFNYIPSVEAFIPSGVGADTEGKGLATEVYHGTPSTARGLFVSMLRYLKPDTYTIRLPRFYPGISGRVSFHLVTYDSEFGEYTQEEIASVSNLNAYLVLYIGNVFEPVGASFGFDTKAFSEGLIEVKRWTFAEVNEHSRGPYGVGETLDNAYNMPGGFLSTIGNYSNSSANFVSNFLYHSVDLSGYTSGQLYDMGVFLGVEISGYGLKNMRKAMLSTTNTDISNEGDFMDIARIEPIPLYRDLVSGTYENYGCMIFKKPQIINKEDTATAENYYA